MLFCAMLCSVGWSAGRAYKTFRDVRTKVSGLIYVGSQGDVAICTCVCACVSWCVCACACVCVLCAQHI